MAECRSEFEHSDCHYFTFCQKKHTAHGLSQIVATISLKCFKVVGVTSVEGFLVCKLFWLVMFVFRSYLLVGAW